MEKSISSITVCHQNACLVMTNGDPEGQIFLSKIVSMVLVQMMDCFLTHHLAQYYLIINFPRFTLFPGDLF